MIKDLSSGTARELSDANPPLVSIIVPTQRRPEMLREAVESILAQTLRNVEAVVVNDGGPDVREVLAELNDPRIVYIRHDKPLGRSCARNSGLAAARGQYIGYLDDDDVFYPDHLERLVEHLRRAGLKVAYSQANQAAQTLRDGRYVITARKPFQTGPFDRDKMLARNYIPILCLIHEKSCLDFAGVFDPALSTHEDWDLWIRLSQNFDFASLDRITCEFRVRDDQTNTTSANRADFLRTAELIYARYSRQALGKRKMLADRNKLLEQLRREVGVGANPASGLRQETPQPDSQGAGSGADTPLVSAIVSAYRSERFLRGCLDDLEAQTIASQLEIIVVNSGSPENEEPIILEYQRRYRNIVYIKTERETVYGAWNRAIRIARGRYLTNANTDDRHAPDAFEKMSAVLEREPGIGVVYANSAVTRAENATLESGPLTGCLHWPPFSAPLLFSVCHVGPQPMWRRSLHQRFGVFDARYKCAGDYEFWLRICQDVRFEHLPQVLGLYLESPQSIEHTTDVRGESEQARVRYWPKHWGHMPNPDGDFLTRTAGADRVGIRPKYSGAPLSVIVTQAAGAPFDDTLRDLRAQTVRDLEIVCVAEQEPMAALGPGIVFVKSEKTDGKAELLNRGLRAATGKHIAYLDSLCRLEPTRFEQMLNAMKAAGARVAYSGVIGAGGRLRGARKFSRESLLIANFIPLCGVVHERSCLEASGCFDPALPGQPEWDLWIRMSRHFDFLKVNGLWVSQSGQPLRDRRQNRRAFREIHKRYFLYVQGNARAQFAQWRARVLACLIGGG